MTESELLAAVIDLAEYHGWRWHHEWDSRRKRTHRTGARGFPDLVLASVMGRLLFVELKSGAGRLTADQTDWIDRLRRAGADVRVWRPDDFDEIVETLSARK